MMNPNEVRSDPIRCYRQGCRRALHFIDADFTVDGFWGEFYAEYHECPVHGRFLLGTPFHGGSKRGVTSEDME